MIGIPLLSTLSVQTARGAAYGELHQVGGSGSGLFTYPSDVAVDPTDNSVYVLDEPGAKKRGVGLNGSSPAHFRIQKFDSGLGSPIASVEVATLEEGGHRQLVDDIAVDPELHRLYVLKTIEIERSIGETPFVAGEILAYSTETKVAGEELQPAPGVEFESHPGVFYEFPLVPTTGSIPPGTVLDPDGLAVDPKTHDLLVLGRNEGSSTLIQQIATATPYPNGQVGETYEDLAQALTTPGSPADGIAVGPDGSLYVAVKNLAGGGGRGVVRLSIEGGANTLAKPSIGSSATNNLGEEGSLLTGGLAGNGKKDAGTQVSVSPDAGLMYATQVEPSEEQELGSLTMEGNYEIRGMSDEGSNFGSQEVVFGGGVGGADPVCHIGSSANAIAAGSGGVVYALDEGEAGKNSVTGEFEPSVYGFRLIEFGPDGSGCPTPSASFTIDGKPSSSPVTVTKGEKVKFDASGSQLNGEEPVELEWQLEGPAGKDEIVKGSPAGLTIELQYLKPGTYTIGLHIVLKNNGSHGNPPLATGTLVVEPTPPTASFEVFPSANLGEALQPGQEIKSEEAVRFDAYGSVDPTGSETGTPTHTLKSYTWSFGDGKTETTSTDEYSRSFTNTSSEPRTETVSLTVTNEEGIQSAAAATQTLTIQGTSTVNPGGPKVVTNPPPQVAPVTPVTPITPVVPVAPVVKKPLTRTQMLAKALRVCRKMDKSKKRRASCEKAAHAKYGPKAKPKRKK